MIRVWLAVMTRIQCALEKQTLYREVCFGRILILIVVVIKIVEFDNNIRNSNVQ